VGAADLEILAQMWAEMLGSSPLEMNEEAAERWWHEELEYVEDPKWPGSTTYHGREEVIKAWHGYLEVFGSAEMKLEDLHDAGDEVVAVVRITGTSKGAEIPFDHVWAYVCRVRDGQLAYQRAYWDPEEALEAAGVDPSP
jgi:ketosteroid isomerase-like protein